MSLLSFAKKIAGSDAAKASDKDQSNDAEAKVSVPTKVVPASAESKKLTVGPVSTVYIEPLVTEKSVNYQTLNNTVVFRVVPEANKQQIKAAVVERYQLTPVAIRTTIMSPKQRRRGQTVGSTTSWKKAYVTLPAGKTIDFNN